MKRSDLVFILITLLLFAPFFIFPGLRAVYLRFNSEHGMAMSFVKFALLAVMGEMIALRLRKGVYNEPGFGILPRALVWGLLGLTINAAFQVFAAGTPALLKYLGIEGLPEAMNGNFTALKLFGAFSISAAMNLTFAPVMMTVHKITDTHIVQTGGTLKGFFSPIPVASIFRNIDWDVMWNFVFKKTIPFFWIPAHTITFLLPAELRILFAALLGIVLGLILSFASLKARKYHQICVLQISRYCRPPVQSG